MLLRLIVRLCLCLYLGSYALGVPEADKTQPKAAKPHVLIVHSYHQGMQWTDDIGSALQEELSAHAELFVCYLDVKRFPGRLHTKEAIERLDRWVRKSEPQLIITVDDFAFELVQSQRKTLPGSVPLVFGGLNTIPSPRPPLCSGVVEAFNAEATIRLAKALQPGAKRLVLVNDETETGLANDHALSPILRGFPELKILRLGHESFEKTEAALASLNPKTDFVLLLSWNLDSSGQTRSYEEAIRRAHACSTAPIYGVWDFYLGEGLLGGQLLGGNSHGKQIAQLALKVLNGTPTDALPIIAQASTKPVIDQRELTRFGLDASHLGENVEIAFAKHSVWHEYKGLILGTGLLVFMQGLFIAWLTKALFERRRAQLRLKTSTENLRLTIESSSDAIITTNASGLIEIFNPAAEQLSGWAASDAKGEHIDSIVKLERERADSPPIPPLATAILSRRLRFSAVPACFRCRDLTERVISFSASPIQTENDSEAPCHGLLLAIRDITRNRQLQDQLRQSQKLESIGLLAGGIAHDFNNILQVINGNLGLLTEECRLPPDQHSYLEEIVSAAKRAGELTRQLLAFGRRQHLQMKPVELANLIQALLRMIQRLIGTNIEITSTVPELPCWVHADSGQIEQVILNLCVNARDAMPQGGRLSVTLTRCQIEDEDLSRFRGLNRGAYIKCSISDTGTGIAPEMLGSIFEPFFTTKKAGQGTGLGLSVVQGILQQHKGVIQVYSEVGTGTTFHFLLPEIPAPGPEEREATKIAQQTSLSDTEENAGLILLADDDPSIVRLVADSLRRHGFEVITAQDGLEACELAKTYGPKFGAVILDVIMPRLGGIEAAREIQEHVPQLPIIICSGFPGKLSKTLQPDPSWVWLSKPFPIQELLNALRLALRRKDSAPRP